MHCPWRPGGVDTPELESIALLAGDVLLSLPLIAITICMFIAMLIITEQYQSHTFMRHLMAKSKKTQLSH